MTVGNPKRMIFNGTALNLVLNHMKLLWNNRPTTIIDEKSLSGKQKYLETEAIHPEKKNFVFSTHAQLQFWIAEVVNEGPVAFLKNLQMTEGKEYLGCGWRSDWSSRYWNIKWSVNGISRLPLLHLYWGTGFTLFQKGTYEARFEMLDTNTIRWIYRIALCTKESRSK